MNPNIYSGTKNTAQAIAEEQRIANMQGQPIPVYNSNVAADNAKIAGNQGYTAPVVPITSKYSPNVTNEEMAFNNASSFYKGEAEASIPTQEELYATKLSQAQKEIDAVNQVYNNLLDQTRRTNANRTGSAGSRQARAGLLGSERGAAIDANTDIFNQEQINSVEAERATKIASIMGEARSSAAKELADKRAAKLEGYDKYMSYIGAAETRNKSKISGLAAKLFADGIDINTLSPQELSSLANEYKVDKGEIVTAYKAIKDNSEKAALDKKIKELDMKKTEADIAKSNTFDLSEGQARYVIDPVTGKAKLIASKAKTYAPTGGSGGGIGTLSGSISPAAQNIINLMNKTGGSVDDYVKGSSRDAQALRNEVYSALNGQGGRTESAVGLLKEAKTLVDQMITNKDWKQSGYSAMFGGKKTTQYGDSISRAKVITSVLAKDNLGLIKGALSDKDLEFLGNMSAGFPEGIVSESYAKDRIMSIQNKINNKIKDTAFAEQKVVEKVIAPDGQEVEIID